MLRRFSSFGVFLTLLLLALVLVSCGENETSPISSTKTPPVTASPVDSGVTTTAQRPTPNPECEHEMAEKTVAPSCTQGYTLHYCKKCSYSYSDSFVEAIGHNYKPTITPPTCTEKGYTTHTCTVCKHSYKDTETAATGHSFGEYVITTEATPAKNGVMTSTCSGCGKTQTRSYEHESNLNASKGLKFETVGFTDTLRLTGLGTCTDTIITVPALYNGKAVVEIGQNVFKNSKVEEIILPETIEIINQYAFANAPELKTVTIPKNVESILNYAYENSPKLETVYFNAINCTQTQSQYSDYFSTTGATFKKLIIGDEVTTIPHYLAIGVTTLEQLIIGKNVTTIGEDAFSGCTALREITLPATLKVINRGAFRNCPITKLTLPEGLDTIGNYAFYQCPIAQDTLTLPKTMTTVGDEIFTALSVKTLAITSPYLVSNASKGVFAGSSIDAFTFPNTMAELPKAFFRGILALKTLVLPNGITILGDYFCYGCPDLESVTIPKTVTELETFVFAECPMLYEVKGSENLKRVGGSAFAKCASLKTLDLSSAIYLGSYLFSESGITAFDFPIGIKSIPTGFFVNCQSLTAYTIPAHVTEIGTDVLRGTGVITLTVPKELASVSQYTFAYLPELKSVIFEEGRTIIPSWYMHGCPKLESITLPQSLEKIGMHAFSDCTALERIDVPDSVTYIGDYAFSSCTSLREITLPSGLTDISQYSFQYCENLKELTVPDSVTYIEQGAFWGSGLVSIKLGSSCRDISTYAFFACTELVSVDFGRSLETIHTNAFSSCNKLEKVILPDTVKKILAYAFSDCIALSELYLGTSITAIEQGAFMNCSSLTKVYLPESLAAFAPQTTSVEPAFTGTAVTFYTPLESVTPAWRYYFGNIITNTSYEEYLKK